MLEMKDSLWFLLGFVPCWVNRQPVRGGWQLEIRALFWHLTLTRRTVRSQRTSFTLRVPLIEKVSAAIWAAVKSL
ncbi:MAG: hypothetical protein HND44_08465 [Chloroflexi bacterium]|nr:hypothetical protein [Ardenticatenaceae bacterium]MBL1128514.1 hypothetical protein [Chloroflexota bacterium]NOG34592.1 hypothetical protein [Chloroflexota bacterium]GIK56672.1 MAG: hypothetical protein BroJett015_23350 [Chloroflexota bacterium]